MRQEREAVTSLTGLQEALRQPALTPATGFAATFVSESIAILESVDIAAIERKAVCSSWAWAGAPRMHRTP